MDRNTKCQNGQNWSCFFSLFFFNEFWKAARGVHLLYSRGFQTFSYEGSPNAAVVFYGILLHRVGSFICNLETRVLLRHQMRGQHWGELMIRNLHCAVKLKALGGHHLRGPVHFRTPTDLHTTQKLKLVRLHVTISVSDQTTLTPTLCSNWPRVQKWQRWHVFFEVLFFPFTLRFTVFFYVDNQVQHKTPFDCNIPERRSLLSVFLPTFVNIGTKYSEAHGYCIGFNEICLSSKAQQTFKLWNTENKG